MYRILAVGSVALIVGLGVFFNWPHDTNTQALSQIAPDFANIVGYINTPPVTLNSLHGKVVLLHFWRIGCPECVKDVPFVNQMYAKYKAYGLSVISIHSPQFDYEHAKAVIQGFVTSNHIKYPVLLDDSMATWQQYGGQYWPRDVIVNGKGYMVSSHIGSGDEYAREQAIRTALAMRNY